MNQVSKFWDSVPPKVTYDQMDPQGLCRFTGTHPQFVADWLETEAEKGFVPDPNARLSRRDRKYRLSMKLERLLGVDMSRRHFRLVRG